MREVIFRMTRDQALRAGLLVCKSCGWPENNHFDHGDRKCAHHRGCTGYVDAARYGTLVEDDRA